MPDTNEKTSFSKVFDTLAERISRKAIIVAIAMILLYLLAVNTAVSELLIMSVLISALAVFAAVLQWILDKKALEKEIKLKELEQKQEDLIETVKKKK